MVEHLGAKVELKREEKLSSAQVLLCAFFVFLQDLFDFVEEN
jgi:hypothetical protein